MKFIIVIFCIVSFSAFGQLTSGNRNQAKKVAILEVVDKEDKIGYGVKVMLRSKLSAAILSRIESQDRQDVYATN